MDTPRWPPPIPLLTHRADPAAAEFHTAAPQPHRHLVAEDWAPERKNRLGRHIEDYHAEGERR